MIKIRRNFIQSLDGSWHNLKCIKSIYVGGGDDCGYRICISYEYVESKSRETGYFSIGETHKEKKYAQDQLDGILELI